MDCVTKAPRDIPGYYYDNAKGKYFKVPSAATGGNVLYSRDDIKRRKTRDAFRQAEVQAEKLCREQVKRSKIMKASISGGLLSRSFGTHQLEASRLMAAHLRPGGIILAGHTPGLRSSENYIFAVSPRPDRSRFDIDMKIDFTESFGPFDISPVVRFGNPGIATSLSVNQDKRKVLMTWLSGSAFSGISITNTGVAATGTDGPEHPYNIIGPQTSTDSEVDVYCSVSAPSSSPLLFVVGTSHGLLKIDDTCSAKYIVPGSRCKLFNDIFAIDFLNDNPNIVLSGGRRGILNIMDMRDPESCSTYEDSITHPSSIIHIKSLSSHGVIVAGLRSSLRQYDLRFRKLQYSNAEINTSLANYKSSIMRAREYKSSSSSHNPGMFTRNATTTPIMSYHAYHNEATIFLGLDVDITSGLIAAAQESNTGHAPVQIFSIHSGNTLPMPCLRSLVLESNPPPIKCIRFANDTETGVPSLYIGHQGHISRFAWPDGDEMEEP